MNMLKDYVNYKLTHADKLSEADGYPLKMENCKKHKKLKELEIYGDSFQNGTPAPDAPVDVQSVGELVIDETDSNYGKYKIPVVTRGKNLIPFPYANISATHNGVTFTVSNDGTITANGTATGGTAYIVIYNPGSNPFPTGTYTMSGAPTADVYIMFSGINVSCTSGCGITFTIEEGQLQNLITCCVYSGRTVNNVVFKPMVEAGAQSTEYEPYIKPITTNIFLDEPLRKIGDYADYVDFKNNKVVRNIKKVVMDGVSTGKKIFEVTHHVYIGLYYGLCTGQSQAISNGGNGIVLNTHFKPEHSVVIGNCYMTVGASAVLMVHPNQELNTVALWNEWLKEQYNNGTPVIFDYVLKEPIEEPLNIDLPKLTAKTTIIEVNTSLAPSNAYGKYIKK